MWRQLCVLGRQRRRPGPGHAVPCVPILAPSGVSWPAGCLLQAALQEQGKAAPRCCTVQCVCCCVQCFRCSPSALAPAVLPVLLQDSWHLHTRHPLTPAPRLRQDPPYTGCSPQLSVAEGGGISHCHILNSPARSVPLCSTAVGCRSSAPSPSTATLQRSPPVPSC